VTPPVDVHASIGGVPYRDVPHPEAAILARVLAREQVRGAWVGDLPSAFAADPHMGHDAFFTALAPHPELRPTPTVHPGLGGWDVALDAARARGAVAVRAYPAQWGLAPDAPEMRALAGRCALLGLPVVLTAHLEPQAGDSFRADSADAARACLGADARVRVLVLAADRATVERTRAGLAAEADARLWWDLSRIAGPPADDLAHLLRAAGAARFVYGSGWPLRLTQVPRAQLELLPPDLAGAALADADLVGAPRRAT